MRVALMVIFVGGIGTFLATVGVVTSILRGGRNQGKDNLN